MRPAGHHYQTTGGHIIIQTYYTVIYMCMTITHRTPLPNYSAISMDPGDWRPVSVLPLPSKITL